MFRNRIARAAVALSLTAGVGGLLTGGQAHAYSAACRSDPAVVLSNLAVIDLSAGMSVSESQVHQVSYVLHGPVGTHVVAVVKTDGLIGLDESFQYVADQPANTYTTATTVTSSVPGTVSATALVTTLPTLGTKTVKGTTGQTLTLHFVPSLLGGLL